VTIREGTLAGENLRIGTRSDILGNCNIGNFVRIHSNVFVPQGSNIGNSVWIYPYVVLTNDPHPPSEVVAGVTIGDYAVLSTMSVILPGVSIGNGALIGAHSLVNRDVPAHMVAVGNPARITKETSSITLQDGSGRPAYPWTNHLSRGYPTDIVEEWLE